MKTRIAQATILLCLIALPLLAASYYGYNTVGMSSTAVGGGELHAAGPFTMPENGDATRIEMYTNSNGLEDCTLGIYSDTASYPNAVLRQTAGGIMNGGSGADDWRGQDLTSTYSITSGTVFWLVENCGTNARDLYYDSPFAGHGQYITQSYSAGALTTPFPGSATAWGIQWSIRLVYTPTGGASAPGNLTTAGAGF